ncbi:hypothetical protein CC80DRAFT_573034 [Byssothecium circinans]|uniref:Uncharacterized protein n=1 Tax=Byssothecium circinans TaxID=147558 RepID=A0A6A5THZ6_9PLEO|nr:hypothetical protein CC80DRAFT_573034 [Byssothecium circinans]
MPKENTTRRSKRLLAQKDTTNSTSARTSIRKQKPSDSRKTSATSAPSIDLDTIDAKLASSLKSNPKIKRTTIVIDYVSDSSSSSSDFSTDNEESEDDEFGENADLSADNFEWRASDEINTNRHHSLDSRYGPENEDYEMDDFVVGDDEEIEEWSGSDEEDEEVRRSIRRVSALSTISALSSLAEDTSSRSSKLFYSDLEHRASQLDELSWMDFVVAHDSSPRDDEPLVTEASADIVEEILDAMAIFSRRCNRKKKPVKLRLASAVMRDEEVKEALERAAKLGLGRKISLHDGSKRWTIGPKEG